MCQKCPKNICKNDRNRGWEINVLQRLPQILDFSIVLGQGAQAESDKESSHVVAILLLAGGEPP